METHAFEMPDKGVVPPLLVDSMFHLVGRPTRSGKRRAASVIMHAAICTPRLACLSFLIIRSTKYGNGPLPSRHVSACESLVSFNHGFLP